MAKIMRGILEQHNTKLVWSQTFFLKLLGPLFLFIHLGN